MGFRQYLSFGDYVYCLFKQSSLVERIFYLKRSNLLAICVLANMIKIAPHVVHC